MKFSVCVATVRSNTLPTAIASIQRQTWEDWELIVVGQGPDQTTQALVESMAQQDQRIRYVHLERYGLSLARNTGMLATNGDIIAMTDDDCEAHQDWLATIAQYFAAQPNLGLVGGSLIVPRKTRHGIAICPANYPSEALYDPSASPGHPPPGWDWIGGNFSIRRRVAERVGLFDEYLGAGTRFPAGEDTDYKLRMEALGIQMVSTPHAIVYHTHGYRYGLKAVLRNSQNYAYGNGALAGKLTLMGDPRGQEWLHRTRRDCLRNELGKLRLRNLPVGLLRLRYFTASYKACLNKYRVTNGLLRPLGDSSLAGTLLSMEESRE